MAAWTELINPALALVLLGLGLACLITRRRAFKQVVGLAIMLQGALLSIMDAGRVTGQTRVAQSMIVSALVVETIVFAIALALIINVFRYHPEGRIDDLDELKG